MLLPVSSPAARLRGKEAGGTWGWDPTSPRPVQRAGTPSVCCHCHHPKQLALGAIFSLLSSNNIDGFQEGREKIGTRRRCTALLMHPVRGLHPHLTHTGTDIPYRCGDSQQSGSVYANDPISLPTDRQDMSKPAAWKEVQLWANALENEFLKVLSSPQFVDTSRETHVLPIKPR